MQIVLPREAASRLRLRAQWGMLRFVQSTETGTADDQRSNRTRWRTGSGQSSLPFLKVAVVVAQLLSHVWLFVTPWTVAHQASLSFTISWSLHKFMSFESVILSNHLILCHSLLLLPSIFPRISFFQWVGSLHEVAKVLELQLQHQSFQWIVKVDFP